MMRWDIFCRVIDNFGDIGVCLRLSRALAARGHAVRLWADDASALAWMAPEWAAGEVLDGRVGVQLMPWQPDQPLPVDLLPGDVVIEAFGCEIDQAWIAMKSIAASAYSIRRGGLKGLKNPVWINLEYLTAERYAERSHGLRSPAMQGPAQGMDKWFFYPGFTAQTGGLIHDMSWEQIDSAPPSDRRISLFCYEPPALAAWLSELENADQPTQLLVTQGRAQAAVKAALEPVFLSKNGLQPFENVRGQLCIQEQPRISQTHYDALLQSCDLNFVRGEDSLARALLAGRAFVWQIYPQQDGAHAAKLEAFLDWLQAPPDWRQFHRVWNGLLDAPLPPMNIPAWTACAQAARQRLLAQTDLVTQLIDFVEEKQA